MRVGLHETNGPDDPPAMTGELVPIADGRFLLRLAALGEDMPLTFVDPDGGRDYKYIHMGARLHRRVA